MCLYFYQENPKEEWSSDPFTPEVGQGDKGVSILLSVLLEKGGGVMWTRNSV